MSRWDEERFFMEFDLADMINMLSDKEKNQKQTPSDHPEPSRTRTRNGQDKADDAGTGPSSSKQYKFFKTRSKTPSVEIISEDEAAPPVAAIPSRPLPHIRTVIPPLPNKDPLRFADPYLLLSSSDSSSSPPEGAAQDKTKSAREPSEDIHLAQGQGPPAKIAKMVPLKSDASKELKSSKREVPSPSSTSTTWSERVPSSDLEIRECRLRIRRENDPPALVRFAEVLLSSLKELAVSDGEDDDDDDKAVPESLRPGADLVQLLELTLIRLEELDTTSCSILPLMNDVLQQYVLGTINFHGSIIPSLIGKFHPVGLIELLNLIRNIEDPTLLIPVCAESPENLMTILSHLTSSSNDQESSHSLKPGANSTNPYLLTNASSIVAQLFQILVSSSKSNVLPPMFQTLITFEFVVQTHLPSLATNKETTKALCAILDNTLMQISLEEGEGGVDRSLVDLIFASLPSTARLLTAPSPVPSLESLPHLQKFLQEYRTGSPAQSTPPKGVEGCPFIQLEAEVSGGPVSSDEAVGTGPDDDDLNSSFIDDDCGGVISSDQQGSYLRSLLDKWSPSPILRPSAGSTQILTSSDEANKEFEVSEGHSGDKRGNADMLQMPGNKGAEKMSSPRPRKKWRRIITPVSSDE